MTDPKIQRDAYGLILEAIDSGTYRPGDRLVESELAERFGVSALLVAASSFGWWPLPMTEVLGFVTGGACVWLTVREHVWNWPLGLANNAFFFILFLTLLLF